MSLLTPLENLIRKLDTEAAAELAAVKADAERKLAQIPPVISKLASTLETAVTDAAEAAAPGLRAALTAAIAAARTEAESVLGI